MRLELEEYNFTVEYLKGKDNYLADALSRITITDLKNIQTSNTVLLEKQAGIHKVSQLKVAPWENIFERFN